MHTKFYVFKLFLDSYSMNQLNISKVFSLFELVECGNDVTGMTSKTLNKSKQITKSPNLAKKISIRSGSNKFIFKSNFRSTQWFLK